MTLGHRSYISTNLELGNITKLDLERGKLSQQIDKINKDIEKLENTIQLLKNLSEKGVELDVPKEQLMSSAVRLKVQKSLEKKPLLARTVELDEFISSIHAMCIQVSKALYPNVKISIGAASTVNRSEYGKCVVRGGEDEITIM